MLILGPAAAPTISAVTWYELSSAGSLITLPSSTTSTAGSVTLAPTSPDSLSTVRTSSTDAFSCLPPQRTIAYTESLSSYCQPAAGAEFGDRPRLGATGWVGLANDGAPGQAVCADCQEYQTADRGQPPAIGSSVRSSGRGPRRLRLGRRRRPR